jgi:hypothetical protein
VLSIFMRPSTPLLLQWKPGLGEVDLQSEHGRMIRVFPRRYPHIAEV